MKRKIMFLAVLFLTIGAIAQNQNLTDTQFSKDLIELYNNGKQEAGLKSASIQNHLWLTPIIQKAIVNWNKLTPEAQSVFKMYTERPILKGTEEVVTYGNFAFHYTVDGSAEESVDQTDSDNNGIPDYVDKMAEIFVDSIFHLYHTTTGLTIPPDDGTVGGDKLYDIYISGEIAGEGTYGYVAPETNIGDNPNSTDIIETNAYTSYMVMRNNYDDFATENGNTDIPLEVTAAHEYMHATQNGYNGDMDAWFMEIGATWSEDFAFPGHDDNLQYLMDLFGKPDVSLNLENGEDGGNHDDHWYASWMFAKYMTEHTGTNIMGEIYKRCVTKNAIVSLDEELKANWNSSLDLMFTQFVIANVVMSADNTFAPYTYSRASVYENYIDTHGGFAFENNTSPFNFTGNNINWDSKTDGNDRLMRLSADYFTLTANQNFKVSFTPLAINDEIGLILLKQNNNSMEIVFGDDNGEISVSDYTEGTSCEIIVIRADKTVTNTDAYDYSLSVTSNTTAVQDFTKNDVRIYPNPASNKLNIKNISGSNAEILIIDIAGREVLRQTIVNSTIALNTLNNGMYFVIIYSNNIIVHSEKLIISK